MGGKLGLIIGVIIVVCMALVVAVQVGECLVLNVF